MAGYGVRFVIAVGMLVLLPWSGVAAGMAVEPSGQRIQLAQIIVRERVIVRVPATTRVPPVVRWKQKRGPRCIAADNFAGAAVMAPDSIDLLARGGQRVRAELEDACPALDFYSGFYLTPSTDRKLCANRDAIHARSGGECQIKRFRLLVPAE